MILPWLSLPVSAENISISIIDIAPSGFKEDGKAKGATLEIANAIAEKAGYTPTTKLRPFPRVVLELGNGKTDMSILLENTALKDKVTIVAPIYEINSVVVSKSGVNIRSETDLEDKKIGIIRHSSFYKKLTNHAQLNTREVVNARQGLKMLRAGRIDALVAVDTSFYFMLKTLGIPREEFATPYVFDTKNIFLQVSNKFADDSKVSKLREIVEGMHKDGTIENILVRYAGPKEE